MKKHLISVTIFVLMIVVLAGCSAKDGNVDALLYTKGHELVKRMDKMAENQDYIKLISSSMELEEIIREIGKKDYSQPRGVYKVIIPKGLGPNFAYGDISGMPEDLQKEIEKRFVVTTPSRVNALKGATVLAASSVITSSDNFIQQGLTNNTLYIYLYEGEVSALVSFLPGSENIVGASASFVINDSLNKVSSDSEMSQWLKEHSYILDFEVEQVEIVK